MIVYLKDGRVQNRTTILDRLEKEGIDVVKIYRSIGTIDAAAEKLGVGKRTLQRWLKKKGKVEGLKIPQWKVDWLKKFYNERKEISKNKNNYQIFPKNLHINRIAKSLKIHRCTVQDYFKKIENKEI